MSGPKKVLCSICNMGVLKSRTYFIGDGKRACKEHEGVKTKSEELQNQERDVKQASVKQASRSFPKFENPFEILSLSTGMVRVFQCLKCNQKGILLKDLFFASAVALKRKELKGDKFDFFNMYKDIREELKIPDGYKALNLISIPDTDVERIDRMLYWKYQGLLSLTKAVMVCAECAEKMGLQFMPPPPDIDLDQVLKISAVTGPLIEGIAKQTLENDKNIN